MTKIDLATAIAEKVHSGQVDKGGKEYILHPKAVSEMCETEDEKIVALLHDTIEDGDGRVVTIQSITEMFGKQIADAVNLLTHRDGEPYDDYICRIKKNSLARKVKMADLRHNSDLSRISKPSQKDFDRMKKYKRSIEALESE